MVQFLQLAVAALALVAHGADSVSAQRQRKAWRDFTSEEKQRYKDAVVSSMKSGLHFQFAEAHASAPNRHYAHWNCGFLLWHRKFLLAYENMLRDQGEEFKDVTLPYWNYFHDSARQVAKGDKCGSMLECSEFLSDMGGLGNHKGNVRIVDDVKAAEGTCAEDWLSKYACASPDGKTKCGCIPRGPWDRQNFLGVVSSSTAERIRSIRKGAIGAKDEQLSHLSKMVEGAFHAKVHDQLGEIRGRPSEGIMSTLASPFDPVFYGHHATVDLVHYVHNHCYYEGAGPESMGKFKMIGSCAVKDGREGKPFDSINQTSTIHIKTTHPQLQKYLDQVGQTYEDFEDAADLGEFSYTYVFDDWINNFLKNHKIICPKHKAKHHHRHHRHHDHHQAETNTTAMAEPVAAIGKVLSQCIVDVLLDEEVDNVDAADYVGYVECEMLRQKQGYDHTDFSEAFREAFGMSDDMHNYCFEMMQSMSADEVVAKVPGTCRKELGELTDTDLVEGFGKKLPCKGKDKENKHGRHVHIKVHSSN